MMTWHFSTLGAHTHVRVFTDGIKAGELCFRTDEFERLQREIGESVLFAPDVRADSQEPIDYNALVGYKSGVFKPNPNCAFTG